MTDDAKSLLAHARHELRTPNNALLGYSEMLLEDDDVLPGEDVKARLQEVPILSRQILETIQQWLSEASGSDDLATVGPRACQALQPLGERVLETCAEVHALATSRGLDEAIPDIERLLGAARRFLSLLADPGLFKGGALPPVQAGAAPVPVAVAEDSTIAPPDWSGFSGTILVVDDNADNRAILARGLIKQGHHFALAANGAQALDMLTSRAFDLVLLDIMMPEMDGYEVLVRIKASPQLKHVPVLMISALDQIDSVVRCIEMGAEDYLPKPFNPLLLEARVGTCLEKKRLRDHELEYLRQVALMTDAATAVEVGQYDADKLRDVAAREDALGNLARVFQRMAREVRAREERLQVQVQQLRVEIDEVRKAKQVAEITETDYFQQLQQKAEVLKRRRTT